MISHISSKCDCDMNINNSQSDDTSKLHRRRRKRNNETKETRIIPFTSFYSIVMIYVPILLQAMILLSSSHYVNGFTTTSSPLHQSSFINIHQIQQKQRQLHSFLSLLPPTKSSTTTRSTTNTVVVNSNTHNNNNINNNNINTLVSSWDDWCIEQLQIRYNQALNIKCPFFRRRISDMLDGLDMILQFIIIRHKSLLSLVPSITDTTTTTTTKSSSTTTTLSSTSSSMTSILPSRLSIGQSHSKNHHDKNYLLTDKLYHLHPTEILSIIYNDWKVDTKKGYYVTGKISTYIYQNDVLFDGPDPDMPVRGLYKYINAASQLFDVKNSYSELISIEIDNDDDTIISTGGHERKKIIAKWKMHGQLRLPWKPIVPEWTGTTTYHINPINGLIDQHIETWDISVYQAFIQTLFPQIAQWIYTTTTTSNEEQ